VTRRDDQLDVHDAVESIRGWRVYDPPPDVWAGVERQLDRPRRIRVFVRAIIAAGVAGIAATYGLGLYRSSWSIEQVSGAPVAGSRTIARDGQLAEGEWLETDASSRARLSIGTLGRAVVGPGSRVQLVQAGGAERALRVERGTIDARVWAPPRFFLVETPAATAVDLGCVYSLEVDARGNGILFVRSGQVELEASGRRSLVVAGTVAQMRPGTGPGTPYSASESPAFRDALAIIDFGGGSRDAALDQVLSAATASSTITLWHLLPRVSVAERERVYDRLAALSPPPNAVTRSQVLGLDKRALGQWRSALEPSWSTERVRLWKRAWRAVWSLARAR
jgi:hypothetical protein